jgi:2-hydroxy-6-oxonona-2,4-dienedioate hydrolase
LNALAEFNTLAASPADIVADVAARGERIEAPFAGGKVVWHCWGKGRPLVLLHGGFGSWTHWIRNVDFLARHYRVLAADMAGYGESSEPVEQQADAVAAAMVPGMRQLIGKERATLAGFSFGGVICGLVAQQAPDAVDAVVLVGAAGMGLRREPMDLKSWRMTSSPEARRELHKHNVKALMIWDEAKIDPLAVYLQQQNAERARFRSRKIARTAVLKAALEMTDEPIAGIWGEHDSTAAPWVDDRRELLQQLRPGAPFDVMPGVGHWVMYEAADAFNALLLRSIDKVKPRV